MTDRFFSFFYKDRPEVDPESPEWKGVHFKEYKRLPRVFLQKPNLSLRKDLDEALFRRKTERAFSDTPLSKETIGSLLFWSVGLIHKDEETQIAGRRSHPSGGALYPIESYIAIFRGRDIDKGVYHYNLPEHSLEHIYWADAEKIRNALWYDFSRNAAAVILLSFTGERTVKKYGALGYKAGLLEAGHIGQNIYLVGGVLGLGILALGGMDYDIAHRELDFDGRDEAVIYQLAIGWPKDSHGKGQDV